MNTLHVAVAFVALAACSGNGIGSSGNSPGTSIQSRSGVLGSNGRILDIRVTGASTPFSVVNTGVTANGMAWPVTVIQQIVGPGQSAAPPVASVGLVGSHTRIETGTTPFDSMQFYGVVSLAVGSRYVVVEMSPQVSTASGVLISPRRVFRVDASDRLAEPALEFPAGTPVSTMMDPSPLPRELLGDPDASAVVPTDASAGNG